MLILVSLHLLRQHRHDLRTRADRLPSRRWRSHQGVELSSLRRSHLHHPPCDEIQKLNAPAKARQFRSSGFVVIGQNRIPSASHFANFLPAPGSRESRETVRAAATPHAAPR